MPQSFSTLCTWSLRTHAQPLHVCAGYHRNNTLDFLTSTCSPEHVRSNGQRTVCLRAAFTQMCSETCVQGIMGTIPWNALVFLTLYMQLKGMSDAEASLPSDCVRLSLKFVSDG